MTRPLGARGGRRRSGGDLTLDAVVELCSSAEQQVDPGAESGVRGQVQGGQSGLPLGPHAPQQLCERTTRQRSRAFYEAPSLEESGLAALRQLQNKTSTLESEKVTIPHISRSEEEPGRFHRQNLPDGFLLF